MTRREANVDRDLAYGPDPSQRADVYHPQAPNGALIVNIHGGGWWQGDKSKEEAISQRFAQAGFTVAAINYRLADGAAGVNLYPTQAEDVISAIDWLRSSVLSFSRERVGAFGGSSGGNLALEAAIRAGVPAASWSGLLDLAGFMARHGDAEPHKVEIDPAAAGAAVDQGGADPGYYKWLLFNLLGPELDNLDAATPVGRIAPGTGPCLLANSLAELVPPEECLIAASALVKAGVAARVLTFEGARHATGYAADAFTETVCFFKHYLVP